MSMAKFGRLAKILQQMNSATIVTLLTPTSGDSQENKYHNMDQILIQFQSAESRNGIAFTMGMDTRHKKLKESLSVYARPNVVTDLSKRSYGQKAKNFKDEALA